MISVIVTNFNYGSFLKECINSVLNQSYQNFELIIVDDGSTDNSKEVLEEYKSKSKKKIKIIYQNNSGQIESFNKAFEMVEGEIVAFLDADDYWYPNKLEVINKYHKKYDGVQHNLLINNEIPITVLEDKVMKQKLAWEKYGYTGHIPTSGLSFTKKSLIPLFPLNGFNYKVCADWLLKGLYLNNNDIFSLNEPLGMYREHGENNWKQNKSKYADFGSFVIESANLVRAKEGLTKIPVSNSFEVCEYICSQIYIEINPSFKYVIFGTGPLAEYIYHKYKDKINIIGFTNSLVETKQNFLNKDLLPLEWIISEHIKVDRIIVASEDVGFILYLMRSKGIDMKTLQLPKF